MIRAILLTACALTATPALAQQAAATPASATSISTKADAADPSSAPPVSTAKTDPTAGQISAWITDDSEVRGVQSAARREAATPLRAVHGVAGVTLGSGGYRSAYAVANMPLSDRSDVTVAIASEHGGNGNRGWRGGYGGPGYGYGPAYGGGDRQSLGIALNFRGAPNDPACDPADAPPTQWNTAMPSDPHRTAKCREPTDAPLVADQPPR